MHASSGIQTRFEAAGATACGPHRKTNADAFMIDEAGGLLAVADGIGDDEPSRAAAAAALDTVRALFGPPWSTLDLADRYASVARERLWLGMLQANAQLHEKGRTERRRIGTTFAGAVVCRDHLCVGHAGDSRAYVLGRSLPAAVQLTEDDTVYCAALRRGAPKELAAAHANARALTRALGIKPTVDLRPVVTRWYPGDVLLLCTDGLSDYLDSESIARTVFERDDLDLAAARLVELAFDAGSRDNVTVVLGRPRWPTELPLAG